MIFVIVCFLFTSGCFINDHSVAPEAPPLGHPYRLAVLAHSNVVAAFTNADESKLLSKTTPDLVANALIGQKRFLRPTDPEDPGDDGLTATDADEERGGKFASVSVIIEKLDDQKMKHAAEVLAGMKQTHAENGEKAIKAALAQGLIKPEDVNAVKASKPRR
ncbi:RxLR effector protein [Phytophthora cinnamomi]|uniref:RxLR effector protein n=1 Tax=Phytophthora cinnamomi TaxID=4785 RepID=UPI003559EF72|nr:RxLR effector protein [Phytophthora cinnamomi]